MDKQKILNCLSTALEKDLSQKETLQQIENLPENQSMGEISLDSISFIKFIVLLEEEFEFELNDSDLLFSNFETLENTYQTLSKYL